MEARTKEGNGYLRGKPTLLKLEQIYFDDSIRDYALKLTGNKLEAEELISTAFEICLSKPPIENLKGYFAMVMRNQYLKKCKKQDPYFDNA